MSYSFQTFTVGQVLTAAQMDQVEVNIRDHEHGTSGVSKPGPNDTHASTWTFNGTGTPGSTLLLQMPYQVLGNFVEIKIPVATATTGTGSTKLALDTALPAAIRPATVQVCPVARIMNNGAAVNVTGVLIVQTSGVMELYRDATLAAFTDSSTCGMHAQESTFVYSTA